MANTQASVDTVMEMSSDCTFMQDRDVEFATMVKWADMATEPTTEEGTLVKCDSIAGSGTSGALTTVDTTTGIITIGRAGKLGLVTDGSFEINQTDEFYMRVYLSVASGAFTNTGFGFNRTLTAGGWGSFASSFHGVRNVGDRIKLFMFTKADTPARDLNLKIVSVRTCWMS